VVVTSSSSVASIAFARTGCVLVGILHPEMSSPDIADFVKVLIYDSPDFPREARRAVELKLLFNIEALSRQPELAFRISLPRVDMHGQPCTSNTVGTEHPIVRPA
jgi:hypothetical protein